MIHFLDVWLFDHVKWSASVIISSDLYTVQWLLQHASLVTETRMLMVTATHLDETNVKFLVDAGHHIIDHDNLHVHIHQTNVDNRKNEDNLKGKRTD